MQAAKPINTTERAATTNLPSLASERHKALPHGPSTCSPSKQIAIFFYDQEGNARPSMCPISTERLGQLAEALGGYPFAVQWIRCIVTDLSKQYPHVIESNGRIRWTTAIGCSLRQYIDRAISDFLRRCSTATTAQN